jgi:hypothetical protein
VIELISTGNAGSPKLVSVRIQDLGMPSKVGSAEATYRVRILHLLFKEQLLRL